MAATPPTLETALNLAGFTIGREIQPAHTITLSTGDLAVDQIAGATLQWQHGGSPVLGDDLYLSMIPIFDEAYRPRLLSLILDRYRDRRIAADTPDQWSTWLLDWANLNMPFFNDRYRSTAVELPLDTDAATLARVREELETRESEAMRDEAGTSSMETGDKAREVLSDFPQSQLSGSTDYATNATDRVGEQLADGETTTLETQTDSAERTTTGDELETRSGRSGRSVAELLMEQRTALLNVDAEVLSSMSELFLGVLDRDEYDPPYPAHYAVWP